jgi:pimeloyl-ACP methyl ester carboxylesterase
VGDIVSAVSEEPDPPRFDVLGISSGTPYSYAIGYQFPERVRNLYIFRGIPALDDEEAQSGWPYEVSREATIAGLQKVALDVFISDLRQEELAKAAIRDSVMHNCFGIAQDFKLRCIAHFQVIIPLLPGAQGNRGTFFEGCTA